MGTSRNSRIRKTVANALLIGGAAMASLPLSMALANADVLAAQASIGTVAAQAPAATQVRTEIADPDNQISDGDKAMLRTETARLNLPPQVTRVEYIILAKNDDKFNDTIEKFIRENSPELIADDNDSFANGALIVAVGLDPHRNGV